MPRVWASSLVAGILFLLPPLVYAQSSADDSSEAVSVKLGKMEDRVKRIEVDTQKILAGQEKILEELDRVRIFCHRK